MLQSGRKQQIWGFFKWTGSQIQTAMSVKEKFIFNSPVKANGKCHAHHLQGRSQSETYYMARKSPELIQKVIQRHNRNKKKKIKEFRDETRLIRNKEIKDNLEE